MKIDNQHNLIISDTDVITSEGKTLRNKLEEIDKLKSNMKFIYKHGTLGSGGGGGGSESSSGYNVYTYIEIDGEFTLLSQDKTVILNGPGNYRIRMEILGNKQSESFLIRGEYESKKISKTLSKADNFTWITTLNIQTNSSLSFIIQNLDTGEIYNSANGGLVVYNYMASAFKFDTPIIVKGIYDHTAVTDMNDLIPISIENDCIFIDNVKTSGMMLALKYDIGIALKQDAKIKYTGFDGKYREYEFGQLNISTNNHSSGIYLFSLASTDEDENDILNYLNGDCAGPVSYKIEIEFEPLNDTKKQNIVFNELYNLIPSDLYLKISPSNGYLFKSLEDAQNADDTYKCLVGRNTYDIAIYNGSYRQRKYTLAAQIKDKNNEISDFSWSGINETQKQTISLPILNDGISEITFTVTQMNTSVPSIYTVTYYVNSYKAQTSFDWFNYGGINNINSSLYENGYAASYKYNYNDVTANKNMYLSTDTELSNPLKASDSIIMSVNDTYKTYRFNIQSGNNNFDRFFALGINYASINSGNLPICSINAKSPNDSQSTCDTNTVYPNSIFIYQDKIVINSNEIILSNNINDLAITTSQQRELYIPKSKSINYLNNEDYHLIEIYLNAETNKNNTNYYSYSVMIDGEYDSALQTFIESSEYDSITFYPQNYGINLIETALFKHYLTDENVNQNDFLTQSRLESYYYTYYENFYNKEISENDKDLINHFSNFTYNAKRQLVECQLSDIENIAEKIDIPVLLLNYANTLDGGIEVGVNGNKGIFNLEDWLKTNFRQEDPTGNNVPVTIRWASGDGTPLKVISKQGIDSPAQFGINIQGSTTKALLAKNLELYAPAPTSGNDQDICVFSPNVSLDDDINSKKWNEMLLPEQSFTLKADVVDSSHCNNNAIGDFVNDNLHTYKSLRNYLGSYSPSSRVKEYIEHKVKKCLTGFPILVFLSTTYKIDNIDTSFYYYLGIYNFNLGRKSYNNLGYRKLDTLIDTMHSSDATGFVIYDIPDPELNNNLVVSEIQANNKFYDFSQFDTTVLYGINNSNADHMFDDFVIGGNQSLKKTAIKNFVENIASAGGYIFYELNKLMSDSADDEYGYAHPYTRENQVPNFIHQVTRSISGDTIINTYSNLLEKYGRSMESYMNDMKTSFKNIILEYDDENDNHNTPILDFRSLSEYYTTCMAFGMVDSVEKNMNIKSWTTKDGDDGITVSDNGTFAPAFYDMDTCLGITNVGTRMSYFAFSDYWQSLITDNHLSGVTISRDYSPESHNDINTSFYDIPSSYLFAIAKYGTCFLSEEEKNMDNTIISPQSIWASWRKSDGPLRNASYFMDKYFSSRLKSVPIAAKNWNYRYKYFVKTSESFDDNNFIKFFGNKKAYTEDWLNNRIHIMDVYMNICSIEDVVQGRDSIEYMMPKPDALYVDRNNKDIYVFNDIFMDASSADLPRYQKSSMTGTETLNIIAEPYAPFVLTSTTSMKRYLFPSTSNAIDVVYQYSDQQPQLVFGGSQQWKSIDYMDSFINNANTLRVTSDLLDTIRLNGSKNITCRNWIFNTPSLRYLSLTGSNFGGNVNIVNDIEGELAYPNINYIDISTSNISLTVSNANLEVLKANNMNNSSIICTGTPKLKNVEISGVLNTLEICAWSNDIELPAHNSSFKCSTISILDNKNYNDIKLTISNNDKLLTLNIPSTVKELYIRNCPNLTQININKQNNQAEIQLRKLSIGLGENNRHSIIIGNSGDSGDSTIDLSSFIYLTDISLSNIVTERIILPNGTEENHRRVNIIDDGFRNDRELKYINGEYIDLYLTTSYSFYNCKEFTGKREQQQDDSVVLIPIDIFVDEECTDLSYTFYISVASLTETGAIDLEVASHFLLNNKDNVKNVRDITSLFEGQNIVYNYEMGYNDYNQRKCMIDLSGFINCNQFSRIFARNKISFLNRYMLVSNDGEYMLAKNSPTLSLYNIITGTENVNNVGSGLHTTTDFLYDIIDKLVGIGFGSSLVFDDFAEKVQDSDMFETNIFNIGDVFHNAADNKHPNKLRDISGFNIGNYTPNKNIAFTIDTIFDGTWEDAKVNGITLSYFLNNGPDNGKYILDASGTNEYIFILGKHDGSYIIPIESITVSFNGLDSFSGIDIYTFLDWKYNFKNHETLTQLFSEGNTGEESLNFNKYVSYEDFHNLFKILLDGSIFPNLSTLSYIFNRCTITSSTNIDHLTLLDDNDLPETINTNILSIYKLFNELSLEIGGEIMPLPLTCQTLKYMPKLTNISNAFSNTYVKYPLSFDFFHKREKREKDVQIDVNGVYENAKLIYYIYRHELLSMNNAFRNVKVECNGEIDPESGKAFMNPFEIDAIYNYDGEHNVVEFNKLVNQNGEEYIIDGEPLATYYDNGVEKELVQPSEIQDILLCTSPNYTTYTYKYNKLNVTGAGVNSGYYTDELYNAPYYAIKHVGDDIISGPFVSPDVFYGCSLSINTNGRLINVFNCNDAINKFNDYGVFSGVLPPHLLYRVEELDNSDVFDCRSTVTIEGTLGGLNILPSHMIDFESYKIYILVRNDLNNNLVCYEGIVPKDYVDGGLPEIKLNGKIYNKGNAVSSEGITSSNILTGDYDPTTTIIYNNTYYTIQSGVQDINHGSLLVSFFQNVSNDKYNNLTIEFTQTEFNTLYTIDSMVTDICHHKKYIYYDRYYQFIPKEFIMAPDINNSFNFKMLLPKSTRVDINSDEQRLSTYEFDHFFIFMNNSLNNNSLYMMKNTTPVFLSSQLTYKTTVSDINTTLVSKYIADWNSSERNDYLAYFNVFGNAPLDTNNDIDYSKIIYKTYITEGLSIIGTENNPYKNLKLDNIYERNILSYLYGNIFTGSINWGSIWTNKFDQFNSLLECENAGMSKYCKIELPWPNNRFMKCIGGYKMSKNNIINYDQVKNNWSTYKTDNYYRLLSISGIS